MKEAYKRFGAPERMEHFILLVSFTMLGVTGLPQRYADNEIAQAMIAGLGGIESIRVIHRFFAIMLMIVSIYHGGALTYKIFVRGVRLSMLPTLKDAVDAWQAFMFNLGLRKEHPKMPRYNFGEKAEYLAVVWGTILMVITGFMLWNPIATSEILPGEFVPIAQYAHSAEALLAILSIIIWHMYNVHIRRFNRSMFTGELSREAMIEEHAAELEEIEAGIADRHNPPEVIERRKKLFYPYAAFMTVALFIGLYYFVTFEDTAIDTVDRQSILEVQDIDPAAGDAEPGAALWAALPCAQCHGEDAQGVGLIPPLDQTELDIAEFAAAIRRGPADMPAYPPSQISDEEIAHLYAWFTQAGSSPAEAIVPAATAEPLDDQIEEEIEAAATAEPSAEDDE